jgi:hypothetical protein
METELLDAGSERPSLTVVGTANESVRRREEGERLIARRPIFQNPKRRQTQLKLRLIAFPTVEKLEGILMHGAGVKAKLKLPRFRGHPTVWVFGVHNGKEALTLRAGIPPADD